MELTININGKDIKLKDILNTINDIYHIAIGQCPRCKDMGDKKKLELIKDIIEKRLNYGKENNS